MSRNIYLLPWATNNDAHARADDTLYVELDWERDACDALRSGIEALDGRDVPRAFSCRLSRTPDGEHTCYGKVNEDDFGDRLKWVPAGALAALSAHAAATGSPRNKAVLAYIAALPADWPVTLFWS